MHAPNVSTKSASSYRADIDGLRAVAVLAVVPRLPRRKMADRRVRRRGRFLRHLWVLNFKNPSLGNGREPLLLGRILWKACPANFSGTRPLSCSYSRLWSHCDDTFRACSTGKASFLWRQLPF